MPDSELFKGVESRSQVGYVNVNRFGHANRQFQFRKSYSN